VRQVWYGNEKVNTIVHDILNIHIQPNVGGGGGGGSVDIAKALVYACSDDRENGPTGWRLYPLWRTRRISEHLSLIDENKEDGKRLPRRCL